MQATKTFCLVPRIKDKNFHSSLINTRMGTGRMLAMVMAGNGRESPYCPYKHLGVYWDLDVGKFKCKGWLT